MIKIPPKNCQIKYNNSRSLSVVPKREEGLPKELLKDTKYGWTNIKINKSPEPSLGQLVGEVIPNRMDCIINLI